MGDKNRLWIDRAGESAAARFAWLHRAGPALIAAAGGALTVAAIGVVVTGLSRAGPEALTGLTGAGAGFWLAFAAAPLVEPLAGCWMLDRLHGTGRAPFGPLLRRQSLNGLLFGYAGDALFLGWLERRLGSARAALWLICDINIASALVNNIATLLLLTAMWQPLRALAGVRIDAMVVMPALAMAAVPLLLAGWRQRAGRAGFGVLLAGHAARTLAYDLLLVLAWHCALPWLDVFRLLMLATLRMVILRLPVLPAKDIAFAAAVALMPGPDRGIATVVGGIALLTFVADGLLLVMATAWRARRWRTAGP